MGLGVLIGAVLLYRMFAGGPDAAQTPPPGMGGPVAVTALTLQRAPVTLERELPGRTVAYQVADLRPQVTGIITQRLFTEGSVVKERQQLYQIDPAPCQAAYQSAQADLVKAEANVKAVQAKSRRYADLVKIEAVSRQEYDDITAQLAQAKADVGIARAALATAKINLNYTKVYAPIGGRIGHSNVTKGALVTANQAEALAQITQLDPIYVDMAQASEELRDIQGSLQNRDTKIPVTVYLESEKQPYAHEGVLQFSEVTVDPTTGSVLLRAKVPNPDGALLPGLFVRAVLKLEAAETILAPQNAVIRNPDGSATVWVIDGENKANPRPVTLGQAMGNQWVIKGGVEPGEVIVVQGFQKLKPGAAVQASFETEAEAKVTPAPDTGDPNAEAEPEP
jgi:membrane fusion protein (multidrug efflux system)